MSGAAVEDILSAVLARLAARGTPARKIQSYRQVLQALCFSFARCQADTLLLGVPVVTGYRNHPNDYSRQLGDEDTKPGYTVVSTLFGLLSDMGLVTLTSSKVDHRLSHVVPTAAFIPFETCLSPITLGYGASVVVLTAWEDEFVGYVDKILKNGKPSKEKITRPGGHSRVRLDTLPRDAQRLVLREQRKAERYNQVAGTSEFAVCYAEYDAAGAVHQEWRPTFPGAALIHVVFNNSSVHHGGRNYNHLVCLTQRSAIPVRETLMMSTAGSPYRPVVELDYKNLHIRMCYDSRGLPLAADTDCYHVDMPALTAAGYTQQRAFVKVLLLALINCGAPEQTDEQNLQSAYRMASKQYREWLDQRLETDALPGHEHDLALRQQQRALPAGVTPKDFVNALLVAHAPIAKDLYSGIGLRLQAIDGQIARNVMDHFAKQGVTAPCLHDSFLVWEEHREELAQVMHSEYVAQMSVFPAYTGAAPVIELKAKTRTGLPEFPAGIFTRDTPVPALPVAVAAPAAIEVGHVQPASMLAAVGIPLTPVFEPVLWQPEPEPVPDAPEHEGASVLTWAEYQGWRHSPDGARATQLQADQAEYAAQLQESRRAHALRTAQANAGMRGSAHYRAEMRSKKK